MTTFIRYFERIGRHNDCKLHNFNKTALAVNNTHRTKPASDPHLHTLRHINHFYSAGLPLQCLIKHQFGVGYASAPASATNQSCPGSAARFAVWSNSCSGIALNTATGAISCCPFTSTGGERAGAIAGAVVGSPTYSRICRTNAGTTMIPAGATTALERSHPVDVRQQLCPQI